MDDLRNIATVLLEGSDEGNLTASIEKLLSHAIYLRNINVNKSIDVPGEANISSKVKMAVARIFQEHLSNIIRHSAARNLWVNLHVTGNELQLTVRDDGVGFNTQEKTCGLGLQNIRARVALLNGSVHITSSPETGCQLTVIIPVQPVQ
jgi:signal transduction histidine kinase